MERYLNRDLSWIEFNARVFSEVTNTENPLLERVKFAGIVSSNFDEFFMVRIASLADDDPHKSEIIQKAFALSTKMNDYMNQVIIPELAKSGIRRRVVEDLNERQIDHMTQLFQNEILPLLTPIALHENGPKQNLLNLSLYLVVQIEEREGQKSKRYAVIEIPRHYSRMITLPSDEGYEFILLEDVIRYFADRLFDGYRVIACAHVRLTRAAELTIDEEKDEDFAKVMSEALKNRTDNNGTRLEYSGPKELLHFIQSYCEIAPEYVTENTSWFDLRRISSIAFEPRFYELKRPEWKPVHRAEFENNPDLWSLLREHEILLHMPYESFDAFTDFLTLASEDPDVMAIKQTLYRAGSDSKVIRALEKAALNKKQVTVVVELKARFDEEANIAWAKRLERAGATVLYGVARLKTHAKACLVVRRESEGIKRYVHLSTGNYNEKTARIYSDLALFTTDEKIAQDITQFFNVVSGYSQPTSFTKIEIAPFRLRQTFLKLIERETLRTQKDHPGLIMAKMNSLVDTEIIEALYKASQAGVRVKLNIRGICCLKPQVPGLSENIEVTSIVDMFLEHSRMYYFLNGGDEEIYLSSADWMPRNFDRRLEILFPLENTKIKSQVKDLLKLYFKDNQNSWSLSETGKYVRKTPDGEKPFRIQDFLCKATAQRQEDTKKSITQDLKPQRPK